MSCNRPLHAFPTGFKTESGKMELIIDNHSSKVIPFWQAEDKLGRPFFRDLTDYIEIPCGRCAGCIADKKRNQAIRCLAEMKDHDPDTCFFFTFTYDDEHLPADGKINKRDPQLFFKLLRRHGDVFGKNIRYFLAGEYGEKTKRPHYHAIIFGINLPDLKKYGKSGKFTIFTSELINKYWFRGSVMIAPVTYETCFYTAGYCDKKMSDQDVFKIQSKGLGLKFFRESCDTHNKKPIYLGSNNGSFVSASMPRSARSDDWHDPFLDSYKEASRSDMLFNGYDPDVAADLEHYHDFCEYLEQCPQVKKI